MILLGRQSTLFFRGSVNSFCLERGESMNQEMPQGEGCAFDGYMRYELFIFEVTIDSHAEKYAQWKHFSWLSCDHPRCSRYDLFTYIWIREIYYTLSVWAYNSNIQKAPLEEILPFAQGLTKIGNDQFSIDLPQGFSWNEHLDSSSCVTGSVAAEKYLKTHVSCSKRELKRCDNQCFRVTQMTKCHTLVVFFPHIYNASPPSFHWICPSEVQSN